MTLPQNLRDKLAALPDKPGCYMMRDRKGTIIYVGKAVSLRRRVQSYFRPATLRDASPKLRSMVKCVADLEVRTLLSGEYDHREAVVTIRSGAGGVDAADFAEMLLRMYLRWAERHGYPTAVLDTSYAEEAGIKSAVSP